MQQEVKKSFQQGKPPTVIFALMTMTNVLINLDHGILPACTTEMQEEYNMTETELGTLGSTVYLGIVLMGLFAGRLYQKVNSKILTLGALILLEVSLFLFIYSDNKYLAYFCRFLTGICQVFLLVYYPIWIDKFGFKKKTLWLTLLQICVPIGIFAGYGMTSVIIQLGQPYKVSFYLQIFMVAIFIIVFGFLSKSKLDSRRKMSEQFDDTFNSPSVAMQREEARRNKSQTSSIMTDQTGQPLLTKAQKKKASSVSQMIKKLLKSKMYFVGTMTMAVVLFVSTGIQFWLTKYFISVLGYDSNRVHIAYAVISITAPTSGCAFGGYVLSKKGGYDSPKAIYWVFLFSCFAIGSAVSIPFLDQFYIVTPALWIVLFCGGAMMPGLTGIMMASVPPFLRAFGNSTGQIIKNSFGYLPAPFTYGWFNELFDDQRAGIKIIMFWGLWAPLILGLGSLYRFKQLKKLDMMRVRSSTIKRRKQSLQDNESLTYGPQNPIYSQADTIQKDQNALISEYLAQIEQQQKSNNSSSSQDQKENIIYSNPERSSSTLKQQQQQQAYQQVESKSLR